MISVVVVAVIAVAFLLFHVAHICYITIRIGIHLLHIVEIYSQWTKMESIKKNSTKKQKWYTSQRCINMTKQSKVSTKNNFDLKSDPPKTCMMEQTRFVLEMMNHHFSLALSYLDVLRQISFPSEKEEDLLFTNISMGGNSMEIYSKCIQMVRGALNLKFKTIQEKLNAVVVNESGIFAVASIIAIDSTCYFSNPPEIVCEFPALQSLKQDLLDHVHRMSLKVDMLVHCESIPVPHLERNNDEDYTSVYFTQCGHFPTEDLLVTTFTSCLDQVHNVFLGEFSRVYKVLEFLIERKREKAKKTRSLQ